MDDVTKPSRFYDVETGGPIQLQLQQEGADFRVLRSSATATRSTPRPSWSPTTSRRSGPTWHRFHRCSAGWCPDSARICPRSCCTMASSPMSGNRRLIPVRS